jgi:hypothetical protein
VVIKFEEKGKLIVQGTLRAVGGESDTERIVFTSLRDGDYGGDIDKATGPRDARGWGGIVFDKTDSSSVLQNAIVRYAAISLVDASPRLIGNLILDSESAGIRASPAALPELKGNELRDNGMNGVAIWKASINADITWRRLGDGDEQLIRVMAGEVTVAEGATLSIEPGTIIKANQDGRLKVLGGLRVLGQEDLPVLFTSQHDDKGGDTNQKLQGPKAADWIGIDLHPSADARLAHTQVHYAQYGIILRGGVAPTIEGWLRAVDGRQAVWCDGDSQLPDGFHPLHNEINDTGCPQK